MSAETHAVDAHSSPAAPVRITRLVGRTVLFATVIGVGLAVTAGWIIFLSYAVIWLLSGKGL
jgi:hypothetical protein